jgi:hypothetical protein
MWERRRLRTRARPDGFPSLFHAPNTPSRSIFFLLPAIFLISLRTSLVVGGGMAPKRVKTPQELEADQIRHTMPFYPPCGPWACIDELAGWVAGETNEHGATLLLDAKEAGPSARLDTRIFTCFLMAGVVPPLSLFLCAILEKYGLLLSQLHPNSLLALAIFQFLCEAFVGVHPSVALFRHYYNVRLESGGAMTGGFTFRLRDGREWDYIDMFQKKWDPCRTDWCWVWLLEVDPLFAEPIVLLASKADWQELDPHDGELAAAVGRILDLRSQGITARHVITTFLWEQVVPLQCRIHPMWAFTGVRDTTRLQKGRLEGAELDRRVNQLLGGTQCVLWLPDGLLPLHERSTDDRTLILGEMPACDAHGPSAASPGQSDLTDPTGPRYRRQLVISSDNKDEAQDQVLLAERMQWVPQALHHSPALRSVPVMGTGTSAAVESAGVPSEIPLSSFLPWNEGS